MAIRSLVGLYQLVDNASIILSFNFEKKKVRIQHSMLVSTLLMGFKFLVSISALMWISKISRKILFVGLSIVMTQCWICFALVRIQMF